MPSVILDGGGDFQADPGFAASARNSAANISAMTCGSSGCRATAPRCRSGSAFRARPIVRRSARLLARACFSKSWSMIRRNICRPLTRRRSAATSCRIDLHRPMKEILAEAFTLSDQDAAVALRADDRRARSRPCENPRARLEARRSRCPTYFKDHPVYYAGPAKTPEGFASGSFGPTTAGRMDSYVDQFQAAGGSLVMLAKGNRDRQVREACAETSVAFISARSAGRRRGSRKIASKRSRCWNIPSSAWKRFGKSKSRISPPSS